MDEDRWKREDRFAGKREERARGRRFEVGDQRSEGGKAEEGRKGRRRRPEDGEQNMDDPG